jgi:rhodanese-related sulfurtransferase
MIRAALHAAAVLLALSLPALADPSFGSLTVDETEQRIAAKDTYIYDCNPRDAYRQRHVPHARWVSYDNVRESDLPADKNATLIFYCASEH